MLALTKKLLYENRDLNLIHELKLGKFGTDKTGLMVVGGRGACELTLEGQPVRCISYTLLNLFPVQVVELPKQNDYVFVAGGLWGEPAAVVMDSEGKVKWRYDARFKAIGEPAVIELGASGGQAVAVFERERGLLFFDLDTGKLLSIKQPSAPFRGIEAIDFDGDGRKELLANDTKDRLITLTSSGEVVMWAESQVFSFAATQSEPSNILIAPDLSNVGLVDAPNVVARKPGKMVLLDRKLQRVASWDTPYPYPGTSYLRLIAAEPLGTPNQWSGLVSLFTGAGSWHKTPLFVHSWDGKLLYEEILEDDYLSILPLPGAEQGTVSFLVGGRGQVWGYTSPAR
ncbi:MAG TPA: hypothetical protein VG324_02265 [Blastocatellia bacterium]|nr:hypothetical protein [Blastocatellia bacterium]